MRIVTAVLAFQSIVASATAALKPLQTDLDPTTGKAVAVYKTTAQGDLKINLYFPPDWRKTDRRPAIVWFFAGSCATGSARQFATTAEYFASRGLVAASAEYRIESAHRTPPEACAEDAKSAVRWLRMNARRLGVDTRRVVAAGGSSGATIAAFAAYNTNFQPDDEDLSISSKPDALVLINPALGLPDPSRLTPEQRQAAQGPLGAFLSSWRVTKGGPPAILFFGTEDPLLDKARDFARQLVAAGTRAEFHTAAGQKHGFFSRGEGSPWQALVLRQIDVFLASLGYVEGNPTIAIPANTTAALDKEL
jgi:acetyl esterase